MPFDGGGAVQVFGPFVVRGAEVVFSEVGGVRGEMDVVSEEFAVERMSDQGALLEAQGLEVELHLFLEGRRLGP